MKKRVPSQFLYHLHINYLFMNKKILSPILLVLTLCATLLVPAASLQAQSAAGCTDVVVQPGDSLSGIAARYLGGFGNYNQIISATNTAAVTDSSYARIANANSISVGWKLCIPGAATSVTANNARPTAAVPTPTAVPTSAEEPLTLEEEYADRWDGTGPFPLTFDYLRQQEYPGSEITIEQTLAPGANYQRYYVSYLSEGLKIYALLTVPNGPKPATGWPAIIFNHGYIPPEIYRTTERYVAYVDGFARNGYIVFRPDYRGHAFSDGEARGAYGRPDYVIDVLNALASVKAYADTDPDRIGMWGHSLGGYITLRSMIVNGDIKAGVIWAGVVGSYDDMINRWRRAPNSIPASIPQRARRWRQLLIDEYGTPEENPKFWNSISANSYLDDVNAPIQLHHGTADTDVPVEFSQTLEQQLLEAGKEVELYTYQGDDHNLSGYFNTVMQRSVAFFDAHVKNR